MASKVFLVIALAFLVQVASSIEDISIETRIKLHKATRQTILAKIQSAVQISTITRPIEKKVEAAVRPIELDLRVLEIQVKIAEKKAKIHNVDISECVQGLNNSSGKIDKDSVRSCKHLKEVDEANKQLELIGDEIDALKKSEEICGKDANPDKCVLAQIDSSTPKTASYQKKITEILKNVKPEEAYECISTSSKNLRSQVDKLREDWTACLKKH